MKCERCGKEHDGSFGSGRFCSRPCANSRKFSEETKNKISKSLIKYKKSLIKSKILYLCLNCNIRNVQRPQVFCSIKCSQNYRFEEYIKKWQNNEVIGMRGKEGISSYIKKYLFEKYHNQCVKCGWNKVNEITKKIPLAAHHKDGNWKNNKEENLELLCPNCHSLTSTFGSLNKGNGRRTYMINGK